VLSEEGWLDTRDYGMLTIDGNLVVTGRAMQTRSAE
jgi:long-subunit acyl-CoA synthetase (AMP-forming)